jgi:uncharacterized protein YbbK (DUF523 family)
MKNDFYVYEHWRTDKDECFYVGKGRAGRAYRMARRNPHHKAIQKFLQNNGSAIEVRIVRSGLCEESAFELEIERISFWLNAGVKLANFTKGGEGASGCIFTQQRIERMKVASQNRWNKEEERKKASEAQKKVWECPEYKEKQSIPRGPMSLENRKKISISLKGKSRNIDLSGDKNPFFGKKHSEDAIRRMIEKKSGTCHSEETKAKMRSAQAKRRLREKLGSV